MKPCRAAVLLLTLAGTVSGVTACQSFRTGSGYDQDCKYNLKKRKSYISCIPEGSSSTVIRTLPLQVSGQSLDHLLSSIENYLGTVYRYGGTTPDGFDCSGFVQFLYEKNFRMLLPRTSGELASLGSVVPRKKLQPGDLVFFSIEGHRIDHVGIFIGKNRFAHAAGSGVTVNRLQESYYSSRYACSTRLIKPF